MVNIKPFTYFKKAFFSLGLVTTFVTPLAFASIVQANDSHDPYQAGCIQDAKPLISPPSKTIFGTYNTGFPSYQTRNLTIQMMASKYCQGNWVVADVPRGSKLYLKDGNNHQYVVYTAQVNGVNYTDFSNWNISYKACVLRSDTNKEVCTQIIQ